MKFPTRATLTRFLATFSPLAAVVGLLFFCVSLTPSLLPREPVVQGVLGGLAFAVGYGVTLLLLAGWRFMQIREAPPKVGRKLNLAMLGVMAIVCGLTLSRMAVWQNSIRVRMDMPEVDQGYALTVLALAALFAVAIILAARLLGFLIGRLSAWLQRILPPRVALTVSAIIWTVLIINIVNGVILRSAVHFLDEAFAAIDQANDDDLQQPKSPQTSGGPESLIAWNDVGKNGKIFVAHGPTREQIAELTGRDAKRPIRVYAGYNTGDDLDERAAIALKELIRVGGFSREVLVVATPTGTGWLDPSSVDPLEYLHGGDIATVSMQYSYLPSWLTIMVDPDRSRRSAKALFDVVYGHWTKLPKNDRPRLYLFGLSLGSLGAEAALDLLNLIGDPIDGAVLSGPPFPSHMWPQIVNNRDPGTPAWLPVFRGGELVRFQNQDGIATPMAAEWGVLRIIYIQHGSDPMVWFSPSIAWREPSWLAGPRAPDVSPLVGWFPLVTFLQVGFDVPMATVAPLGHAHNYAPREYIDAWLAVSEPRGWTAADTAALKKKYEDFTASPL